MAKNQGLKRGETFREDIAHDGVGPGPGRRGLSPLVWSGFAGLRKSATARPSAIASIESRVGPFNRGAAWRTTQVVSRGVEEDCGEAGRSSLNGGSSASSAP